MSNFFTSKLLRVTSQRSVSEFLCAEKVNLEAILEGQPSNREEEKDEKKKKADESMKDNNNNNSSHNNSSTDKKGSAVHEDPSSLVDKFSALNLNDLSLSDLERLQTLGTGTFGRVFLVRHKTLGQYFALKVLKKADVVKLKQVEHVSSERSILSSINHPFIVKLYKTFKDETNIFMLMEYIIGGELFSHLRRAGRFNTEVTTFYASEIVCALEYMHSLGIVYRDLKPENLLLDTRGHIKITDFGFAKRVEDRTWTLCGTPEYLAPEIIQSKGHGKAVDWWALGILIFEMLAGYPPFFDDNPFGIYEKILIGKIQFPSHFDPAAKDLIKKLLTADRTRRLGNLKNGAEDVKRHKFFKGIDWNTITNPNNPTPIVPEVSFEGDTQNFEVYPEPSEDEETAPSSTSSTEDHKDLFADF